MPPAESDSIEAKASRYFPPWDRGALPRAPEFGWRHWSALIGPGLLMVGSNIGGGEWLFGPIVAARHGGQLMWIATVSIGFQIFYNLTVMRYTLYTGEPIFVGFFRTPPGPKFWAFFYLLIDLGGIWPYLASNAAVPLAAAILGRLPGPEDDPLVRTLGYAIFLSTFVPLIFGGKIYNSIERVMTVKVFLVLGYLGGLCLVMVDGAVWRDVLSGLVKFGSIPAAEIDWATMAAFAAAAGAGGLSNMNFSNYTRDKGWGMGPLVGAIPSMIGGREVKLSHVGKVFPIDEESLKRWRGWVRHIVRDQVAIWGVGCLLGMVLPAMLALQFRAGAQADGHAAAAMMARGVADRAGEIFWPLTLLCGFIILAPGQIAGTDGTVRRWTDVIWTGSRRVRHLEGHQVKNIYYTIMTAYGIWGLIALRLTPNPLVLAIVTNTLKNIGLAFSSLHALYVNRSLLPPELRLAWYVQVGLIGSFLFFLGISAIAFHQRWEQLMGW